MLSFAFVMGTTSQVALMWLDVFAAVVCDSQDDDLARLMHNFSGHSPLVQDARATVYSGTAHSAFVHFQLYFRILDCICGGIQHMEGLSHIFRRDPRVDHVLSSLTIPSPCSLSRPYPIQNVKIMVGICSLSRQSPSVP